MFFRAACVRGVRLVMTPAERPAPCRVVVASVLPPVCPGPSCVSVPSVSPVSSGTPHACPSRWRPDGEKESSQENDVATDDEQWGAKFKVLKENVEHHIQEEESEMFRTARGIFSRAELQDLAQRMVALTSRSGGAPRRAKGTSRSR